MAFKFVEQNYKEPMLIYKLTNTVNGKIYIGQTTLPFNSRWSGHTAPSSKRTLIDRAIKKYGKEKFLVEVELWNTLEELNVREVELIKQLDSCNRKIGYNLALGGKNTLFSDESKLKMSISKKALYANEKLIPWNKGKTSENNEMIRITALNKKGKVRSQQSKDNMSKGHLGKTYSELHGENAETLKLNHARLNFIKQNVILQQIDCNQNINSFLSYKEAYQSLNEVFTGKGINKIKRAATMQKPYRGFYWKLTSLKSDV